MVYFVGAGPGAIDLITVRGANLISQCDTIIYAGSLVNPQILNYKKDNCIVYNSAEMTLEQVIKVILESEQKGLKTVRLHTGDPSIYGAIREQMDELDKHKIEYEVVPGVSSFLGAASSLQVEYTLPDVSQTVILTRMKGRTPVPEKESIANLASHNATMIIFLSMSMLNELTKELIDGGYNKNTRAAIVYKATWNDEKIIRTTIENLEEDAQKNNITKTALVLIGEFLGDDYRRSDLYNPSFTHEFRKRI